MNPVEENPVVLLVDDEPANLAILIETLQDFCDLIIAKNGREALERAAGEKCPDLILMDVQMPVMSGYEACANFKANARTAAIPVIFITVLSDEEDETRGFELGAVDYITKPFSPAVVRARVQMQMELKKHRDHLEALAEARAQQLIHAERLATLGSLSAGIVHEINNPLAYISLSAEMMQRELDTCFPSLIQAVEGQAEATEDMLSFLRNAQNFMTTMSEGVERVTGIMKSMKNFSRRDAEEKQHCALGPCISDALKLCSNELKYVAEVKLDLPENLPCFAGISRQIEQVFINLFHNAAQAMEPQRKARRGLLHIRGEADAEMLRIVVEDNGPGIPQDKLDVIWEAFYTTKPSEEGTGLGLSISRGIIQDHLGKIRAENSDTGGARFIVELPIAAGDDQPPPAGPPLFAEIR
ncbi:MAG: response regulator [Kiritimatiellae bacterium]|nr:response regulator [Kiritimatiellia bacterium]